MPALAKVIEAWEPKGPRPRQSPAEIRDVMGQWRAVMGGLSARREKLRRKRPAKKGG